MLYGNDRKRMRQVFFEAWRKHRQNEILEPLERRIVAVIRQHPEYHALLERPEAHLEEDFAPEQGVTNPFLHMGMHLGIAEQLAADMPPGIRDLYQRLTARRGDAHAAEHEIMECLGETLWLAQRAGAEPDPVHYLTCLRKRLGQSM